MRVTTYVTRNFATLGPSELRPPFTGASVISFFKYNINKPPISFTFRHWAGVSPHTLSYDFAETYVFGKQSPGPGHCNLILLRHPFSRSYGAILPSSLERVISRPLVYSTYLPVLVYGTDNFYCKILRAFLGSLTSIKL